MELQSAPSLPLDIVVECLIGLLLASAGAVVQSGKLKPLDPSKEFTEKSWDEISNLPSFSIFNHRGQKLKNY